MVWTAFFFLEKSHSTCKKIRANFWKTCCYGNVKVISFLFPLYSSPCTESVRSVFIHSCNDRGRDRHIFAYYNPVLNFPDASQKEVILMWQFAYFTVSNCFLKASFSGPETKSICKFLAHQCWSIKHDQLILMIPRSTVMYQWNDWSSTSTNQHMESALITVIGQTIQPMNTKTSTGPFLVSTYLDHWLFIFVHNLSWTYSVFWPWSTILQSMTQTATSVSEATNRSAIERATGTLLMTHTSEPQLHTAESLSTTQWLGCTAAHFWK